MASKRRSIPQAVKHVLQRLSRPASVAELTPGLDPDPLRSAFGAICLMADGEPWPESDAGPMIALCQVNCAELAHFPAVIRDVPSVIPDIAFIRVWVPADLADEPDGKIVVRASRSVAPLLPLTTVP